MLARRLTTILPEMRLAAAINTTRIHRVAGRTDGRTILVISLPCRVPPQPIPDVGRIGGGQVPRPGEVSLAPHSVRLLDTLGEFRRYVLEVLSQPLGLVKHPWAFTPARAGRFRLTLLRGYGPMDTSVARLGHR
jgi:magnesium chelatase family protein